MRTPLAWLNLVHNKVRTAVAVAGVTFAVVLIFMQLGFLGTTVQTADLIYNSLGFDLLLRSCQYRRLSESGVFPQARLYTAASLPEVARVCPLDVAPSFWRNPHIGRTRMILTMGVRHEDPVFTVEELDRKVRLLSDREYILVDRLSRPEFGPRDKVSFGDGDVGTDAEVNRQRVKIVGHFLLGAGFEADGAMVVNDRGFRRLHAGRKPEDVNLGLVQLQPGADPEAAVVRMREILPGDVQVLTKAAVIAGERKMWIDDMAIGVIFQMGVAVALIVGTAIVYQVLSSDVTNHLPEYATLKAMGYRGGFLARVVLQQAVILALLGFLPGLAFSLGLYAYTHEMTKLPMDMPLGRVGFVLALSVVMCTLSGLGALRKVYKADPADLY
jgi:putative ABC transport system permease protein